MPLLQAQIASNLDAVMAETSCIDDGAFFCLGRNPSSDRRFTS
jgi:hypothetical protein